MTARLEEDARCHLRAHDALRVGEVGIVEVDGSGHIAVWALALDARRVRHGHVRPRMATVEELTPSVRGKAVVHGLQLRDGGLVATLHLSMTRLTTRAARVPRRDMRVRMSTASDSALHFVHTPTK